MAYTEKPLVPGSALTASAAGYYTVPAATTTIVKEIEICNTDSVTRTFTLYMLPTAGTSPGVANTMFISVTMQPSETKIFGLTRVLTQGNTISAFASQAGVVALNGSGVERT